MSQTSYTQTFVKGFEGMLADSRENLISTLQAAVAIKPGRGVVKMYGVENQCRLPVANQAVLTDDAGTFTAGSIAVTVNGTVITQAWGTDKNTTMTALAAAIQAGVTGVYSAVYSSGSHTITLKARNIAVTAVADLSGVTGTMALMPSVSTSLDTAAMLVGVAVNPGAIEQVSNVVEIAATAAVSVLEEGAIYVIPEETVTADDVVYLRVQDNSTKLVGMFGKSADSGKCVLLSGARWVEGGTGLSTVAKLQLNLPQ
jgi:hypothetical protein